jgi:hypothetical protein
MADIAKSRPNPNTGSSRRYPDDGQIQGNVEQPSNRYRTVEARGLFKISVPANWRQFGDSSSITFAPEGAYGNQQGESIFTHGAMVGAVQSSANNLKRASDEYVSELLQNNNYLRSEGGLQSRRLDGHDALKQRLSGISRVTNRREIVDIYTTMLNNRELFYIVQVAPDNDQRQYSRAFDQMVQSLRFLN